MNCEHEPLINGDPEESVIKTIPPPPLHTILLGPVNHIMKELFKRRPNMLKTISALHIQRSKYHGRNFEGKHKSKYMQILILLYTGPQCRSLLKKIEELQIPEAFNKFKDVLLSLRDLHHLCNAQLLSSDYHQVIEKFRSTWFTLTNEFSVSTTPKIHILLDHIEDYFDETNVTLIKSTDELCENMHQFLNKRLMRSFYLIKDTSNPNQGKKLHRAVRHFNSYNLSIVKKQ